MTQTAATVSSAQAELLNRIDKIPQRYFGEVVSFLGYLQHKAQQEAAQQAAVAKEQRAAKEKAAFIRYAEELNAEAEDVLLYQDTDSFEEDLERLTPSDIALMRGTVVQFNQADILFDSKKEHPV